MTIHSTDSIQDPSIWNSYRRADLRCRYTTNRSPMNQPLSSAPICQSNKMESADADLEDVKLSECDPVKDKMREEIRKLRRLVKKKDLVIDFLIQKIGNLRRLDVPTEDGTYNNECPTLNSHPSYTSALTSDISCGSERTCEENCTCPEMSLTSVEDHNSYPTCRMVSSKAIVNSEFSGVDICKCSKHTVSRLGKYYSTRASRYLENMDNDIACSVTALNDTYVISKSPDICKVDEQPKIVGCNTAKILPCKLNDKFQAKKRDSSKDRSIFMIEGFSSRSEDIQADWKASPLPLSLCLRVNRPDLIRRIEKRQAAIITAANLRHQVTKEKMKAARDIVQGKCSVNNAQNTLMLDPTRIAAFPKSEMVNLTKRRLRQSSTYKSGVLDGRKRVDIAASKVIAQSFSEATRQAVLAGRSLRC